MVRCANLCLEISPISAAKEPRTVEIAALGARLNQLCHIGFLPHSSQQPAVVRSLLFLDGA